MPVFGSLNVWGNVWLPWVDVKTGKIDAAYFDPEELRRNGQADTLAEPGKVAVRVEVVRTIALSEEPNETSGQT